jgi:hypothetical protein
MGRGRQFGSYETDPYSIPRPHAMVAAMLEYKTGIKMSGSCVRKIEKKALGKIRKALEGMKEFRNDE